MTLSGTSKGLWAYFCTRILKHVSQKANPFKKAYVHEAVRPSRLQPSLIPISQNKFTHLRSLHHGDRLWYKSRSNNSAFRRSISISKEQLVSYNRSGIPSSIPAKISIRIKTTKPFTCILRPNLTGGALPRTSGGYSTGRGLVGGVRCFSDIPVVFAQVIHDVSTAGRAFWSSGQQAYYDGRAPSGEKSYRRSKQAAGDIIQTAEHASHSDLGSYIDFKIVPTITALPHLVERSSVGEKPGETLPHLNTAGILEDLSDNFARASKDFSAILSDLTRLSLLGDLLITLENNYVLRVHFPGRDREELELLCDDFGVEQGIIHQKTLSNEGVNGDMGLRFPYAPSKKNRPSLYAGSSKSPTAHESENPDYSLMDSSWFSECETASGLS